jgi:hypothetical protein
MNKLCLIISNEINIHVYALVFAINFKNYIYSVNYLPIIYLLFLMKIFDHNISL